MPLTIERELEALLFSSDPTNILTKCLIRSKETLGSKDADFTNAATLGTGWVSEEARLTTIETCEEDDKVFGIKFTLSKARLKLFGKPVNCQGVDLGDLAV